MSFESNGRSANPLLEKNHLARINRYGRKSRVLVLSLQSWIVLQNRQKFAALSPVTILGIESWSCEGNLPQRPGPLVLPKGRANK
jgi:hypothetical protein